MTETSKKKVFDFSLLGRVFHFVRPYRGMFYLSLILAVVMALFAPIRPYLIQLTVDTATGKSVQAPGWLKTVLFNTDLSDASRFIISVTLFQIVFLVVETSIRFIFSFITASMGQHVVKDITETLRGKDVNVRFAIHPVAGRLPGHMNVLLAEANVPYDIVFEMDEINDDLPDVDVLLVVGANDIVNPSALEDSSSPIAGMPVIEAWNAKSVVALKRSMAAGYSGVENPLYFKDNTNMLFGDAKDTLSAVFSKLC